MHAHAAGRWPPPKPTHHRQYVERRSVGGAVGAPVVGAFVVSVGDLVVGDVVGSFVAASISVTSTTAASVTYGTKLDEASPE